MEQKEYWNNVSEKKEFTTPFQSEEFSKYVKKENIILDVGCGYGRILKELYNLGYKNLIGIDFSETMIKRAKNQLPNLDLRVKKSSKIEMLDNSVDAIILFGVLTCITKNDEQQQLIDEIYRVLKTGGIIYINDFLLNNDDRNLKRYNEFKNKYEEYGTFELSDGAVLRHHSEEWIKTLLKDFETIRFENLIFTTMNGHTSNGFYFIGKK